MSHLRFFLLAVATSVALAAGIAATGDDLPEIHDQTTASLD